MCEVHQHQFLQEAEIENVTAVAVIRGQDLDPGHRGLGNGKSTCRCCDGRMAQVYLRVKSCVHCTFYQSIIVNDR